MFHYILRSENEDVGLADHTYNLLHKAHIFERPYHHQFGEPLPSLQKFLKDEGQGYLLGTFGVNKDGVDGIFGKMTENAVKQQQSPFESFKISFPNAEFGKVSKEYFDMFIKGKY